MQSILLTHEVFTLTGSDTASTRLSERQQHLATAHFLKLTGNFYHWAQNQQQSHSSKPQLPSQTDTPLSPRSSRCWYWGACRFKLFGLSRDVSCGRCPRGWAAAARLPPAVVQLRQPQTVGRSALWQRIDAEKTGSLTYSCLLCLHQIWERYNNPRSWPDPCECALLCFFPHMGHISSLSLSPPLLSLALWPVTTEWAKHSPPPWLSHPPLPPLSTLSLCEKYLSRKRERGQRTGEGNRKVGGLTNPEAKGSAAWATIMHLGHWALWDKRGSDLVGGKWGKLWFSLVQGQRNTGHRVIIDSLPINI